MTTAARSEADAAAGGGAPTKNKPPLTKRQRRKHVNPSNTWPQQPKIQSAEARAKANLRVAGLLTATPPRLDPAIDVNAPEIRFTRQLAATNQRTRHNAVMRLESYLKMRCDIHNNQGGISELDLLKIWKGLWYTLFLADKVPVQDELSKRLAKLIWCVAGTEEEDEYAAQMYLDMVDADEPQEDDVVMEEIVNTLQSDEGSDETEEDERGDKDESEQEDSEVSSDEAEEEANGSANDDEEEPGEVDDMLVQHCRGAHLASLFVKTFFKTMQREWGNMDKHRIDKFYTLVRLMLHEIFQYMALRHWNRGIIFLFNDTIRDEVLFHGASNGLRLHLIDITMEELAKVNMEAPMPLTEATFLDTIDPYLCLAQHCDDAMVHSRVMEHVFEKFLNEYSVVGFYDDDERPALDQVHVGTVAKFLFDLASGTDTQERYRKALYDMHKTYMKRLKKVGKDVVLDEESSHEMEEHDEGVAPEEQVEETEAKPLKRKRHEEDESEPPEVEAGESRPTEKKAKKKKKKKRKKRKSSISSEEGGEDEPVASSVLGQAKVAEVVTEEEPTEKPKEKKKKKRKPSISSEDGAEKEDEVITITVSEQKQAAEAVAEETPAEKPRKKKKKKRKSSMSSEDGVEEEDEVITMTMAELRKKKKESKWTPEKTKAPVELSSEEKRVSFGRVNHSKSYKASMKALKTMDQPPLSKSPDRGILRSRIGKGKSQVSKRKKSRKKAADYF